jgi:ATP-dependent RNA helicase RhlE
MAEIFADFALNRQILNAIEEKGYLTPTPIQQKAIPSILSGQDVMGIAQTGTGKTAAYVLPLIMKIKFAQGTAPRAVVLVPTRELAMQVKENVDQYSKYTDLRNLAIYGGTGTKAQIETLEKGVDILIATPGRFLELYLEGHIILKKLQVLIMDEADRLMDMGFIGQLHRILEVVPRKRQNLLFSATASDLVKKIAGDFLEFPTVIEVSPEQATASTVSQLVYEVPNYKTKLKLLLYLLRDHSEESKIMVFCKTKSIADEVFNTISEAFNYRNVRVIHGNKEQNTRINSMKSFKEGNVNILIATDVVARGIDISSVRYVINFDVPIIYEDYIHRIGRTGRAMQTGDSITFCTPAEVYHLEKIQKLIRQEIPKADLPKEVKVSETPYEEKQAMDKELDNQKRKEDPTFKGAFHEKKPIKKSPTPRSTARQSKRLKRR